MKFITVTLAAFALTVSAVFAAENTPHCGKVGAEKAAACWIEKISWVDVSVFGTASLSDKKAVEDFIRLRVANDMKFLEQEHSEMMSVISNAKQKFPDSVPADTRYVKTRAGLHCEVWSAGDQEISAYHIECKIISLGRFSQTGNHWEMSRRRLGYTSTQYIDDAVKKSIAHTIEDIGAQIIKDRADFK